MRARTAGPLEPERIPLAPFASCGGHAHKILKLAPRAARLRHEWLPHADWVELDGVGHCPQLDVPLETAQLILGFTGE